MRTIITIVSLLICSLSFTNLSARDGHRIVTKVANVVELLEDDHDQTVASIQIDQLTKSSVTRTYTRTLYSGNTYIATAVGDANFTDVDLTVYRKQNGQWVQVDKDADSSNTAIVQFRCNSNCEYKFEVKAYSFASGSTVGYYGFILSY